MFTLLQATSKENVATNATKTTNETSPNTAALIFGAKLLKNVQKDIAVVKLVMMTPYNRRFTKTVVKQKLNQSYNGGYRFLHYIK